MLLQQRRTITNAEPCSFPHATRIFQQLGRFFPQASRSAGGPIVASAVFLGKTRSPLDRGQRRDPSRPALGQAERQSTVLSGISAAETGEDGIGAPF
jgi:hypothetical protein